MSKYQVPYVGFVLALYLTNSNKIAGSIELQFRPFALCLTKILFTDNYNKERKCVNSGWGIPMQFLAIPGSGPPA